MPAHDHAAMLAKQEMMTASAQEPAGEVPPHEHPPGTPAVHDHSAMMGAQEVPPHEHPPGTPAVHDHAAMMAAQGAAGHEHSGATPGASIVQILLGLTLAIALGLMLLARRALRPNHPAAARAGSNLLDWPVIGKLLGWKHFSLLLALPTLAIFAFIVLAGLMGEQDTSNPAVLLTWILWWPAVIFSFILLGRIWCVACPFGYVGDLTRKLFSFNRKVPNIFKNMWWRMGLFLALTWATTMWALDRSPWGTAWLGLIITMGAVGLGVIYEKRTFCRYVCPLGGIFGLYSMTAPVRIGVKDRTICQHKCPGKECYKSCAWFEFASTLNRNTECNLCLDCVRACPHHNVVLQAQLPATDLAEFRPYRKSWDEATTVASVLGVALLQTVVMLNAWQGWQASIASFLHLPPGPVLYTIIFLTVGVVIPVLLVLLITWAGAPPERLRGDIFHSFRTYAYAFLPLGLGLHAAHNFHHLFGEGGAMVTGVRNALAQYTGWASLAAAGSVNAASSIGPNTLFFLQWAALAGGLFLAYRVTVGVARRDTPQSRSAFGTALPVLLFAVAYTVLNFLVLSAPMAHRH
ncbi:MAG: 4Fe-4S binding protein [Acidobacteria bacterium]|nr:4Fe-4S binding protein [Acidobacteriota bacterium]